MNEDYPTPDYQLGLAAQLACIWEATARKPGNVHRFADFADTTYLDFIASAAAMAPVIAVASYRGVGATVCECVRLRGDVTPRNTNLGIALLLAPLAKASHAPDYRVNVRTVLDAMDDHDAKDVYRAIAMTQPGGLGDVAEQDVRREPTAPLLECMALAQDRDLIARQYVNGFADIFDVAVPAVLEGIERTNSVEGGIVYAHLRLMATYPDSLIARKRGDAEARESANLAHEVLAAGWPQTEAGRQAIRDIDRWLRVVGNARNPGTTADMIAAAVFVLLRTRRFDWGGRQELPWALDIA